MLSSSKSSPPSKLTRWLLGGSAHDHLSLRSCPALLSLHLSGLRHHAAIGPTHDDPLRCLLLCPLCRRHDRGQLGHVAHQALSLVVKARPGRGIAIDNSLPYASRGRWLFSTHRPVEQILREWRN